MSAAPRAWSRESLVLPDDRLNPGEHHHRPGGHRGLVQLRRGSERLAPGRVRVREPTLAREQIRAQPEEDRQHAQRTCGAATVDEPIDRLVRLEVAPAPHDREDDQGEHELERRTVGRRERVEPLEDGGRARQVWLARGDVTPQAESVAQERVRRERRCAAVALGELSRTAPEPQDILGLATHRADRADDDEHRRAAFGFDLGERFCPRLEDRRRLGEAPLEHERHAEHLHRFRTRRRVPASLRSPVRGARPPHRAGPRRSRQPPPRAFAEAWAPARPRSARRVRTRSSQMRSSSAQAPPDRPVSSASAARLS